MLEFLKKFGLLPKLILAIVLGILIGKYSNVSIIRGFVTFSSIFNNFLTFVIPLIIIGFVAPGIGDLGKGAGKLLGFTTVIAYISTLTAGTLAYFVDINMFPKFLARKIVDNVIKEGGGLQPYFQVEMPPIMGVMTALLIAFILGIGISIVRGNTLKNLMGEVQTIVESIIKNIIIPLLPIHILGIFANMTYEGKAEVLLPVFSKVFMTIIVLHITILVIQYFIAGTISASNPIRLLVTMIPAYFTAIGTQSSAATIPVTLGQTKKNGVNSGIAEFVIPLCATIHLSGSTITLVSCAMGLMTIYGQVITFKLMFGFIMMLGITMIAAPGVPGGAVMAAIGIIGTMLGFDEKMQSLMIALYIAQDSFGTACNVTGDGAIAIIVNKLAGFKLEDKKEEI